MQVCKAGCTLPQRLPAPASRRSVLVRSDQKPTARVTREFREGDDEVKKPSSSDAMYVDDMPRASRPKPASNLSPEMQARLKAEYTGWGGSPNKAMSGNYFLNAMIIVAILAIASKLGGAL